MNARLLRGVLAAIFVILMSPLLLRAIAADAPVKGDQWETTSQMSMEGMPMEMPKTTLKICAAKDRAEPPAASRPNCTNTQYHRDGDKVTWTVQCTDPEMTGTGEITYANTDSYTGTIKFTSQQGTMTIKLAGRKLGECDNPQ